LYARRVPAASLVTAGIAMMSFLRNQVMSDSDLLAVPRKV
jgi:hypothetical protein